MGKRSAVVELFLGDMGSIQRETRPSIQREDQLTMETKLEQIAAKCCEATAEERSAVNPHATFCGSVQRSSHGQRGASPLDTQGGSRMPELGPYGSVRVAPCKRVEVCRLR